MTGDTVTVTKFNSIPISAKINFLVESLSLFWSIFIHICASKILKRSIMYNTISIWEYILFIICKLPHIHFSLV